MIFVTGNKSRYDGKNDISTIISEAAKTGCTISFISAKDLITNYLSISNNNFELFIKNINYCLRITRSKDTTKKDILNILDKK